MNRREFIGIAAVAGTTGGLLPVLGDGRSLDSRNVLAMPHVLDVLRDERLIRELGAQYCAMFPTEQTPVALERAIVSDLEATEGPLEKRIHDRVRRDFATGRTLAVNGWILSLTEARQCALHALTAA